MGITKDTYGSTSPNHQSADQWHNTIDLLRLVQSDYQGARKQLDQMSHSLAESEARVSEHLQYAFFLSHGYQTLCLVKSAASSCNQLGKAVLGQVVQPPPMPSITRLYVRCLGRFEVGTSTKQVERWHSAKAKSILQYLLIKPGEAIIKDTLMEAMWPDCTPQAANNNLKAAVHGLRLALNSLFLGREDFPFILFSQGSYSLNPEIELRLDVEEFENQIVSGRRLEKEGKTAESIRGFEQAESLYRGDYLEDEPYEEWTLLRREALKDTYLIVLGKLADHCMSTADYESCILYCQKILDKDHCREDAYRRLMCCYSRLGQRNRSFRWYEICCQTVQMELDTTPDHETTALYNRILRDERV